VTIRTLGPLVLAAALLSVSGCAHPQVGFVCPTRGGRPWLEVRSAHHVLSTDLDEDHARELAGLLEDAYVAFDAFFNVPPDVSAEPLPVLAFRSRVAYEEVVARPSQAVMIASGRGLSVVLTLAPRVQGSATREEQAFNEGWVTDAHMREIGAVAVRHELAHAFAHRVIPRQPWWVAEGLAEYLETVEVRDGRAYYGELPRELAMIMFALGPVPARRLFEADSRVDDPQLRATALLAMHLLAGTRAPQLSRSQTQHASSG
jgi:hypothetical protein